MSWQLEIRNDCHSNLNNRNCGSTARGPALQLQYCHAGDQMNITTQSVRLSRRRQVYERSCSMFSMRLVRSWLISSKRDCLLLSQSSDEIRSRSVEERVSSSFSGFQQRIRY